MMDIYAQMKNYLAETLGIETIPEPWLEPGIFPYYLIDQYEIGQVMVLDCPCVLLLDIKGEMHTPAQVEKHVRALEDIAGQNAIYVRLSITSYDRKRLIERKIAFIVPRTQLYLPFMAIDLRERYKNDGRRKRDIFNPATQRLLLTYLQNPEWSCLTIHMAAQYLGYTGAAMSGAFNNLKNHGIGQHWTSKKERCISFPISRRQLWEQVQAYLRSPVARIVFIRYKQSDTKLPDILTPAGLNALAQFSNLAEASIPVCGIDRRLWTEPLSNEFEILYGADEGAIELQLWHYPLTLPQSREMDRLSLYLSLKDDPDERLQGALSSLLEEQIWYQD